MLKRRFYLFIYLLYFLAIDRLLGGVRRREEERGEAEDCVTGVCESRNGGFNFYSVTRRWLELRDGV